MEKKDAQFTLTESEFLDLLVKARNKDEKSILILLHYFEPDMRSHSRYIKMPKEDALQSMRLAMIELFHHPPKPVADIHFPDLNIEKRD